MRAALLRATTIAAASATVVLAGGIPAHAADLWVEVNPSTIQAGFSISIRASCGDNVNPAKVKSDAFGEQTMLPNNGFLYATVSVPENKKPKGYTVTLSCPNGSSATTTLFVLGMDQPSKGPHTGGGGLANGAGGGLAGGAPVMLAGGLTVLGLGTALGLVALRRRRTPAGA
ncbi:MAG TPA: hypothetical protein VFE14_00590 [Micromonosporaceae bacterium]|nr:hypothetical protein [Micromonosporaceae bacterium]